MLEDRALLSIAQDLVSQLTPYQNEIDSALDAATLLPLVGDQLASLQELDTILQDSLPSIETQTQGITTNDHYSRSIPLPSLARTFTFDLGLDAFLQVSTAGGVSAAINPSLNIGFDYQDGVVTLDADETALNIGFNLSLPNFMATMSLNGLLYTHAEDAGSNFQGNLGFNFDTTGNVSASFSGEADVRLDLTMSFVNPAVNASFNPTFYTTLDLDWGFGTNNQLMTPTIELQNFRLDADSFLQGFLGDVVTAVQKFTKPIQPFIDMFETPVPIVSAFGSSETIGTLMLKGAGHSQEQQDRFELMVDIIKAVNTIDLSGGTGGAVIPFGTIKLTGDAQQSGAFGFDTSLISGVIDDILNSPELQEVQDALETVGNYTGLTSTAGFKFPLLENPGPVIGAILTGQTETMFSFSIGRQHFNLEASVGVGIKDLFGVFLSAGIVFDANLSMGYDTAGLIAVGQDPSHPELLLHGFYFDNSVDATAPPIPNHPPVRQTGLYLDGFMELSGSAIATLSGGLTANINVELVNTDASPHVHLDTMLANLDGGGKVFDLSGKVFATGDISLTLPPPIGTLFTYNLAYDEILNFDPPPPPDFMLPVMVMDETNQHTLLLDVNNMAIGSRVTVQPFHDLTVPSGFAADGIRVDYPNKIVLYVERKNDANSNYYNLIGLNGAVPDGVSIQVTDPFRVFYDEGAPNPSPAQTKPGVLLVGGKNVAYKYVEVVDGSQANVLLVGGYGSNTLSGGTMTFGNFIPADRIAQAKAHFADTTGYDGAGQGLINSVIDAAVAPANPTGIMGATMTGSRGGLMLGGPGNNSFFAAGAGMYEMIGGTWVDSFSISPSFSGGTATYQIDGGPNGDNSLVVRVPAGDSADFENGTVPDKYDPAFKALDIYSNAGLFTTAHGIQKVTAAGSPGSTIVFGDTSELDIDFKVIGSGTLKFGGSPAPDQFQVTAEYVYYGTKDHRYSALLLPDGTNPPNPVDILDGRFILYAGSPIPPAFGSGIYGAYVDGPFYTVTRTFGTNGHTQSIQFNVGDSSSSSMVLDGRGGSDDYHVTMGLGNFFDITIDDSDATTQNSLLVDIRSGLGYHRATLSDNSLHLEYYVSIGDLRVGGVNGVWLQASVAYSPTVFFGANADIIFAGAGIFQQTIVNRPTAPQNALVRLHGVLPGPDRGLSTTFPVAYDPEQPNAMIVSLVSAGPTFDIQSNAGSLSFDSIDPSGNVATFNVYGNTGTLSFAETQIWGGWIDTYNVFGNAGTINVDYVINGSFAAGGFVTGLSHVVNVRANSGTINLHDVLLPALIAAGIDAQVNVGDNGSLANIHGTINLSHASVNLSTPSQPLFSIAGRYGLLIDDRNNPGTGGPWLIDFTKTRVGDLTINYQTVNTEFPYQDTFSQYQAFPKTPSTATLLSNPRFYTRQLNGVAFPTWQLNGHPAFFTNLDGDTVNISNSLAGNPGGAVTYSATNLPAGLSINPSTGQITGVISLQAYLASPYETVVAASNGTFTRGRIINWNIFSGIGISVPNSNGLLGHEGAAASLGPITTTNRYNQPVTLSATGLPTGLSFDPQTGVISGTIAIGAAQNSPYHVVVHATDGTETAEYSFDWRVTGITLVAPAVRTDHVGDSVNLAIQATSVFGGPLSYSAQGLPEGLSINPASGLISGVISDSPSSIVDVTVTEGNDNLTTSFHWTVLPIGLSNVVELNHIGTQTNRAGDNAFLPFNATSSLGLPLEFTVQGLPPGVEIELGEGYLLFGEIAAGAASASPYQVTLTATDGLYSDQVTFDWIVATANTVNVTNPGNRNNLVGNTVNRQIQATSTLGQPLTYGATGLPPGLSINPQTGLISGTVLPLAALPSIFDVSVTVTDGTSTYGTTFLWTIRSMSDQINVIQLSNPAGAGTITVASPSNTILTAAVTDTSDPPPPGGLQFPFGFLSFTITGQYAGAIVPGGAVDVTITLPTVTTADGYFRYGATPANLSTHWYNFLYQQQTDGDDASTTGAVIQPNGTIVLHLVDGGRGDDDLALNGVISDLGGPAIGTITPPPELPGDYNLDGVVDPADYAVWRGNFGQTVTAYTLGDGNGDGKVDTADYTIWRDNLGARAPEAGTSLSGDYDGDSVVGESDFVVWKSNFGQAVAPRAFADGNGDGIVDAADYTVWRNNFGATSPGSGSSLVDVEPKPDVLRARDGVPKAVDIAVAQLAISHPAQSAVFDPRAIDAHNGQLHARDSRFSAARRDDGLLAWLASRFDAEARRRTDRFKVEAIPDSANDASQSRFVAIDTMLEPLLTGAP